MKRFIVTAEAVQDCRPESRTGIKVLHYAMDTETGEKYGFPYSAEYLFAIFSDEQDIFNHLKELVEEHDRLANEARKASQLAFEDLPF